MRLLSCRTHASRVATGAALRRCCAALAVPLVLAACTPEVGSEQWCEMIREKELGDITANETADYARHCVLE